MSRQLIAGLLLVMVTAAVVWVAKPDGGTGTKPAGTLLNADADCETCIAAYKKWRNELFDNLQAFPEKVSDGPLFSSSRIDTAEARAITKRFVAQADFTIPLCWTFDAWDIRAIARDTDDVVNRVKVYAALDSNNRMTLVMVGLDARSDSDRVMVGGSPVMFEYADPCPPMCGKPSNILHHGVCQVKRVTSSKMVDSASCNKPFTKVTHGFKLPERK